MSTGYHALPPIPLNMHRDHYDLNETHALIDECLPLLHQDRNKEIVLKLWFQATTLVARTPAS